MGQSCKVWVFPNHESKTSDLYLFQEVEKPEMGFANHEFIQLWTEWVPVGPESFLQLYERVVGITIPINLLKTY